jgi:predicted lipid-binding transport protein (Tim44 family)
MGLRQRLKDTLGELLGGAQDAERRPQPYRSPVAPIIDDARAKERAQAEERARAEAERAAAARADRFTPAASPAPAAPEPPKDADAEEKQRKFMARARKGLLTKVQEAGGAMPLGDLHDHSEKRYFIAHRAFSTLMEEMVAEGLLDYESGTGIARLTEAGRAQIAAP